eukprot:6478105-Amphidinium_carterae.1
MKACVGGAVAVVLRKCASTTEALVELCFQEDGKLLVDVLSSLSSAALPQAQQSLLSSLKELAESVRGFALRDLSTSRPWNQESVNDDVFQPKIARCVISCSSLKGYQLLQFMKDSTQDTPGQEAIVLLLSVCFMEGLAASMPVCIRRCKRCGRVAAWCQCARRTSWQGGRGHKTRARGHREGEEDCPATWSHNEGFCPVQHCQEDVSCGQSTARVRNRICSSEREAGGNLSSLALALKRLHR